MGHLINPTRYRLGNSIFWANNWPAIKKTEYFLFYEIQQEMDQYFRNLFYNFRKFKAKKQRKGGHIILRKIRHPKLYYSHVNINFWGLNLDKMMVDVNIYDFFLDNYLTEALSSNSINKPDAPNIAKFFKKFNRYIGFEFFFKHKRVLQKMTKQQFSAVIKICRNKINLLEQIAINKLQSFIEIYTEFVRKSLFSVFNDKINIFNPTQSIFYQEKKALNRLSFSRRIKVIDKYWTRKYSHTLPETKTLLTFKNYFTSEFYSLVTPRGVQNPYKAKNERNQLATSAYFTYMQQYKLAKAKRYLALTSFSTRIKRKLERYLKKTSTGLEKPGHFFKSNINSEFRTFPKELASKTHTGLYDKDNLTLPEKKILGNKVPLFLLNFGKKVILLDNLSLHLAKWPSLLNFAKQLIDDLILLTRVKRVKAMVILNKLTNENYLSKFMKFLFFLDQNLKDNNDLCLFLSEAIVFIKHAKIYNRLQYKYIKTSIKKSANYWLKYDLDPFYQQYMKLKQLKNLYLNINFGIAPEVDKDHDVIDAKFIALYIKRLFKRNKFKVPDLQRTVYRSLSRLPYLDGFLVIFAGRFTRRESKIRRISKRGIIHFGAISKLIDYHTIGFAGKFGYCGIKIFLQYKAKWPIKDPKRKIEINNNQKALPMVLESHTNTNIITNPIILNPSSKRYTRLVQNLFSKNQIPYYYGKN